MEGKRLKYSREDLHAALDAMADGMSTYRASIQFQIPRTTLLYKQRGVYAVNAPIGHPTILSAEEEAKISEWIIYISKCGFPATKDQLLDSVQLLLKNLKRENKFKNGRPGRRWYEGYLKRNPEISVRVSQHLVKSRAIIKELNIRSWFKDIYAYIEENKYEEILQDPKRIFNCDESAFLLAPKETSVLTAKGAKAVYNTSNNDEKECLTTLIMVNAAGEVPPPMFVFKYKRIPFSLGRKMPKGWGMGCSDSGWMTGEVFYEYIANVFLPWLINNGAEFPVVLFLDGHVSHLTLALSEFCKENKVILIALYPNATHLLQPLDVGVFRPLKTAWKTAVHNWKLNHEGKKLKAEDFSPLLESILLTAVSETTVKNAFRTCGIYPFSADGINYEKLVNRPHAISTPKDTNQDGMRFLRKFESYLSDRQLNTFMKNRGDWCGKTEDKSLYDVWIDIKHSAENQITLPNIFENSMTIDIDSEIEKAGEITLDQNMDIEEALSKDGENNVSGNVDGDICILSFEESELPSNNVLNQIANNDADNISSKEVDSFTTPQKEQQAYLEAIETPYRKSLFWPTTIDVPVESKFKKRVPTVIVSSDEYIAYKTKKQLEKEQKISEKLDRKNKREAKKLASSVSKKSKVEKISPVLEKNMTCLSIKQLKKGNYVIVQYEGEYFPGIILEPKKEGISVKVMGMSGSNWKWPEKDDILVYNITDIVMTIKEPTLLNSRGIYCVPEIQSIRNCKI